MAAWERTPPVPCPRTFVRRGGFLSSELAAHINQTFVWDTELALTSPRYSSEQYSVRQARARLAPRAEHAVRPLRERRAARVPASRHPVPQRSTRSIARVCAR